MAAEREPMLMIATGKMGGGKSFVTEKLIRDYMKAHPHRPVLVFDPNGESTYAAAKPVHFDILEIMKARKIEKKKDTRVITKSELNIQGIRGGGMYRVLPRTIFNEEMTPEQMLETFLVLCQNFRGGLLVFDDINKYIQSFAEGRVVACMKAIRHKSQDMIMHMQSFNPVRPVLFEACSVFRMHKDRGNLSTIADRIPPFEIMRISQIIVDNRVNNAKNDKDPNWYFFLYVHVDKNKIVGATVEDFKKACNIYLTQNMNILKGIAAEVAAENKRLKPNYNDFEVAREKWINNHMSYIE